MIGRVLMIAIAVTLLLTFMGKLRRPKPPRRPPVEAARKCAGCGAYVVADARCATPGCAGS